MRTQIQRRYGTERGWVRLALAELEYRTGQLHAYTNVDLTRVRRFVFVCLGNICRSPYAEHVARRAGLPCASLGLSTTTGAPAFDGALATAAARGADLSAHRATDWLDFEFEEGDLLLGMEVRQVRQLTEILAGCDVHDVQVALLGQWAVPRRLHIHDPHTLGDDYFVTCFDVIESAVEALAAAYLRVHPQEPARKQTSR
jgi:protein-tyrosine phosphatase